MIRNKLFAFAAVVATVAMTQTAQASISLGDLVSTGGSITVGDKVFSEFGFTATGLTGFNANSIIVTASVDANGVYFLTFGGNMQLAGANAATADLLLNYTVTATGGQLISMIDQRYTGGAFQGGLLINETATGGAGSASSQLAIGDVSDPDIYPNGTFDTGELDLLGIIPPQATLTIVKDITFSILADDGNLDNGISQASVSSVQQSFHQVPEPTTMIAGGLLLLPFGASTIRFLRRQRAA